MCASDRVRAWRSPHTTGAFRGQIRAAACVSFRRLFSPAVEAMNVLVVEDHDVLASMLVEELTGAGHEVIGPAQTSGDALRLAEQHHPRFAFVDLDLERKAVGLELTERLTADLGVNVIICTAQPDIARRVQSGAIGLISKPYLPRDAVAGLAIVRSMVIGEMSLLQFPVSFELLINPQ